ncbi:DHA2 family efflux MFS transporter permease subunit [Salinisphaera sp. USBA-960]|uniref:DHA2 family efflux MFS transporter permease subunit n=1 Tax=Salinisphaera orenii TaxID=856731 RepID=UPI000DBE4AF2|nr:DHA2 family efflux MFS transporter permease subunit [Salifodinibacter halophilus]NNC26715.1 DHA2 family efflux MFS transporter permease subunit [Salifodinibacter halophilus]
MTEVERLFERYGPKYRWLVTLTVLLGLVALGMSITIVNVATPYIKGAFGMSSSQVQWLSTGFLAATTVSLLVSPWLVQAFGQRYTFVGLLLVFIAASVLGGMANGMGTIITARVIQGAMTGVIRPVALEALFKVFPPGARGMATAMYGMSLGLPLTLASVIGGYLIEHYNWRYVFYIVLPICVAAIVMGWLFLPDREQTGPRPKLDWIGAIALFASIFSALAAIANGQRWGWHSTPIIALLLIAAGLAIFFIAWVRDHPAPILDLDIFKSKEFLAGSVVLFLFGGAFYGVMYLLPQFMSQILHYSPVTAGMLFTPSTLVLGILVPLVGRLSDRLPSAWLTLPGLMFAMFAVYRMSGADPHTSFDSLALSMAILSVGMATVPPPTLSRSISALPTHLIGYGSGTSNFALQLGGAFGTVFLVAMLDRRTLSHSATFVHGQTAGDTATQQAVHHFSNTAHQLGVSQLYRGPVAHYLLGRLDATWATIMAYQDGFLLVAAGVAAVTIPAFLLSRWGDATHG